MGLPRASRTVLGLAGDGEWSDRRRGLLHVFAADHERVPQLHHVDPGAIEPAEVEELRFPVRPMVMMNRYFGNTEAGVLDLLHHLQTDDAAVLLEVHLIEDRATQQTKIAVDVTDLQPEEQLDDVVIDTADDDSMQRIRSADLVPVDEIDAIVKSSPQGF